MICRITVVPDKKKQGIPCEKMKFGQFARVVRTEGDNCDGSPTVGDIVVRDQNGVIRGFAVNTGTKIVHFHPTSGIGMGTFVNILPPATQVDITYISEV